MKASSHFIAPDVLRGVAILMVLFFHLFTDYCGASLPWAGWWKDFSHPPTQRYILFFPLSFGWVGVPLFFIISGFCIHNSFLKSAKFTWQKFFWKRFWRLYPAYIVALLFFAFYNQGKLHGWDWATQVSLHALLVHNVSDPYFYGINPSFWSLATEAQLYLLFPILIFLRQRLGLRGCLIVTSVVSLLSCLLSISSSGLPNLVISQSPFATWFVWALGAFVAEKASQQQQAFSRHYVWLLILIPLFVLSTLCKPFAAFSFLLAGSASAVVLDLMLQINWPKGRLLDFVVLIGTISYSLYLWHQPMIEILSGRLSALAPCYKWPLVFALLFLLAYFSELIFERNGLRLGEFLLAQRAKPSKQPRASEPELSEIPA